MVFNILIILLVGLVAYFHYVQGFFSATISAMITVLAAVFAVSYHENLVNALLRGKMADYAHAMTLCMLFAVGYIVLRVIFDFCIPGNVRTPSTVDRIGSALMGIVAGIFATGIFAIAVQMLPFDAKISWLGYSRYEVADDNHNVFTPGVEGKRNVDTHIDEELKLTSFSPAPDETGTDKVIPLWLHVDDIVLDTCYYLSKGMGPLGGPLSGERPLASIHPDYLHELYGERLGIQTGAQRSALRLGSEEPIDVSDVFVTPSLPAVDGQVKELRTLGQIPAKSKEVKAGPGQSLVVIRVSVNGSAVDSSDKDEAGIFRFSTGAVRVVGKVGEDYKDFHPIGTLEYGKTVLLNKPDDFLFMHGGESFDAVFLLDSSLIEGNKLADGVLINVKRFGFVDLSGHEIKKRITVDKNVHVLRSGALAEFLKKQGIPLRPEKVDDSPTTPAAPVTPAAPAATPVNQPATPDAPPQPVTPVVAPPELTIDNTIDVTGSVQLGTTVADQEAKDAPVAGGGTMTLKGGQIYAAKIDPNASLTDIGGGATQANTFFAPQEASIVQVSLPCTSWDVLGDIAGATLTDSNGNSSEYRCIGFYVRVKGDTNSLLLRFNAGAVVSGAIPTPASPPDGNIFLIFSILHSTEIKAVTIGGKTQNFAASKKVP